MVQSCKITVDYDEFSGTDRRRSCSRDPPAAAAKMGLFEIYEKVKILGWKEFLKTEGYMYLFVVSGAALAQA